MCVCVRACLQYKACRAFPHTGIETAEACNQHTRPAHMPRLPVHGHIHSLVPGHGQSLLTAGDNRAVPMSGRRACTYVHTTYARARGNPISSREFRASDMITATWVWDCSHQNCVGVCERLINSWPHLLPLQLCCTSRVLNLPPTSAPSLKHTYTHTHSGKGATLFPALHHSLQYEHRCGACGGGLGMRLERMHTEQVNTKILM